MGKTSVDKTCESATRPTPPPTSPNPDSDGSSDEDWEVECDESSDEDWEAVCTTEEEMKYFMSLSPPDWDPVREVGRVVQCGSPFSMTSEDWDAEVAENSDNCEADEAKEDIEFRELLVTLEKESQEHK